MYYALKNLKAYILATLETTLAAIELEESITIERWKTFETHETKNLQFPVIELLPSETGADYGDEESPLTEHWETHSIDLELGINGNDEAAIQRDLLLYREAIRRIVAADMTGGGAFNRLRLGRAQFSPLITSAKEKKLLKILRQNLLARVLSD